VYRAAGVASADPRARTPSAADVGGPYTHRVSLMTKPEFDQDFWEQLWSKTLREHGEKVARHVATWRLMLTYLKCWTCVRFARCNVGPDQCGLPLNCTCGPVLPHEGRP
jgi:hypothetical protein